MIDQREAVAYHEAGHAVVSMKLGYRCLYVTITPDGSRLGHACCEDPLIGGHDHNIEHALKVLIAASVAEGRHVGSRTWGDADDRVKATNLALSATDRDAERAEVLINEMIGEARKLVEQHWPDIEALAHGRKLNWGGREHTKNSASAVSAANLTLVRSHQPVRAPFTLDAKRRNRPTQE